MSVVSKNPFELLGDDEPRSSSPAPKAKPAAAPAAPQAPKVIPGAAPKGSRGGRYPARGGPRNVYKEDRPVEASEPGFEGERVAPSKKIGRTERDRHTKGPREDRPPRAPRGPGGAGARGPKGGARAPRTAESGEKKPTEQYTNEEGKADLTAETQGEKEGAAEAAAAEVAEEVEPEEEDNSKTLDQYLAERAEKALGGNLGKKEIRQVSADDIEGKVFSREEEDAFFAGKSKETKAKAEKAKKEKVFIEIDGQFARPERPQRETRGDRPQRGGQRGARGGQRGGPRGGAAPRAPRQAVINPADESAFPSLA